MSLQFAPPAARRLLIAALVLLALAGGASFLVWRWAEGQLADGVARWRDAMRARGWTVAAAGAERGGWPLAAELTLPDFAVAGGPALPVGVAWRAARVVLRVELLRPRLLLLRVDGEQSLRFGAASAVPFTADRFTVTLPLAANASPRSAALDAAGIRAGPPADGLSVGLLEGQASWDAAAAAGRPAMSLRLSAEAIALPPPPAPQAPLGPHIASATVEATLTGPLPPAGGRDAMVAAWRSGGGTLELSRIAIGWGPLGVTGGASLSLDAAMQPTGTATLRLVGIDDALAALVAGHVVSAHAAQAVHAVLGLLARGGEAAGVTVPLTLRDQTLSMGLFPLAKLPRLVWPDAPGPATIN